MSLSVEEICIPTAVGDVRAHLHQSVEGQELIGAVVIHPATAVPERLYFGFAEHLADSGFVALSYDYSGTGGSGEPRSYPRIRMRDWMMSNVPAVATWMRERFPELPHLAVGHSVGGHALSLNYGTTELAGFITIASHAGVTAAIQQRRERLRVGILLRFLGPALARGLGYVPGRRIGLGEDMPAGAMLEWSRWTQQPGYFFDDRSMRAAETAARVQGKVLSVGFADDLWATPQQIDFINNYLINAKVERLTISPAAAGVSAIGHMGFFRRKVGANLWPVTTSWLIERAGESSAK